MLNQKIKSNIDTDRAIEGVLITRKVADAHKAHLKNIDTTRQYINRMMNKGYQEAEQIKQLSYQKGFEQGFLDVVNGFTAFLSTKSGWLSQLSNSLESMVVDIFKNCFDNKAILLSILENSIKTHGLLTQSNKMTIFLPATQKNNLRFISDIKAVLAVTKVDIVFHDTDRYVIKNEDQVIEFNQPEKIEQIKQHLQHHLLLHKQLEQLQADIRQQFIDSISMNNDKKDQS